MLKTTTLNGSCWNCRATHKTTHSSVTQSATSPTDSSVVLRKCFSPLMNFSWWNDCCNNFMTGIIVLSCIHCQINNVTNPDIWFVFPIRFVLSVYNFTKIADVLYLRGMFRQYNFLQNHVDRCSVKWGYSYISYFMYNITFSCNSFLRARDQLNSTAKFCLCRSYLCRYS